MTLLSIYIKTYIKIDRGVFEKEDFKHILQESKLMDHWRPIRSCGRSIVITLAMLIGRPVFESRSGDQKTRKVTVPLPSARQQVRPLFDLGDDQKNVCLLPLRNPHCSMAIGVELRPISTFVEIHQQWWNLHISEKFSRRTKNIDKIFFFSTIHLEKSLICLGARTLGNKSLRRTGEIQKH